MDVCYMMRFSFSHIRELNINFSIYVTESVHRFILTDMVTDKRRKKIEIVCGKVWLYFNSCSLHVNNLMRFLILRLIDLNHLYFQHQFQYPFTRVGSPSSCSISDQSFILLLQAHQQISLKACSHFNPGS